MSKFELIKQTLLGNLEDRIPISVWKHHPEVDRTPQGLADAEIDFFKKMNQDLLKISFFGHFPCIDFGCTAEYEGKVSGSTTLKSPGVEKASDWEELEPVDVNAGEFGKQIQAVGLIHEYAQDRVPTMATVFDPSMVADKICDNKFTEYVDDIPEVMNRILEMLTKVTIEFAKATLDAGADGIFLASQHSTKSAVTDKQYRDFVLPYDKKFIAALRGKAKFIIMHLHAREEGEEIRFDRITKTPGLSGVNWEDQSAALTLAEGKKKTRKSVFGGIDHNGVLREGDVEDAEEQVLQAIKDAGLKRLVLAPGCVITVDTPPENIRAVVDTVQSIDPWAKQWEEYV